MEFLIVTIILISLVFSALFSATETSITGLSDATIHKLKTDGDNRALIIMELRKNRENLIGTILVANNTFNILASSLAAGLFFKLFGEEGVIFATVIMTIVIILFAEVLPKTYAIINAEKCALMIAPYLKWLVITLKPITNFIRRSTKLIFRILNIKDKPDSILTAIDELRGAIDMHHSEGIVKKHEKDMLGSILDLNTVTVKEVMVHRKNIVSINADLPIELLIKEVLNCKYTRIPVWKDNYENIVAYLHVKDLLNALKNFNEDMSRLNILDISSEPWFIPENTTLKHQLLAFKKQRKHCALVIDEYGDLKGLVTLNDILEAIVGDMNDEHDKIIEMKKIDNKTCEVIGSFTVRELNRELDWHLPEDAITIAGLLINKLEKIPKKGEEFFCFETKFVVLEKNNNQILKLRLTKLQVGK